MLLLHVSDFHFGPKSRFADLAPADFAKRFAADLKHQLGELKLAGGIDVVVATGDFAESGTKKEFAQAADFLRTLAHELGLPPVRFVLLPGNHDISWAACQIVELEQKQEEFDDEERDRRIHAKKLEQYQRMVADFYSPSTLADLARPLAGGGWLYDFADLGLSVAALNSCEKETHRPGERYGFLSTAQSQDVLEVWSKAPEGFRVLALHHPPVPVIPANVDWWRRKIEGKGVSEDQVERSIADLNGIQGSHALRHLAQQTGCHLVLHGHQHAGDSHHWSGGYCHVLSAGSLCLVTDELPADEPLSCRLIELEKRVDQTKVWSLVYAPRASAPGRLARGAFRLDTVEEQPRELPIKAPKTKAAPNIGRSSLGVAQEYFLKAFRLDDTKAQPLELPIHTTKATTAPSDAETRLRIEAVSPLVPEKKVEVYISYAWGDDSPEGRIRSEVVERLCEALRADGFEVRRDSDSLRPGELISHFVRALVQSKYVVAIISEKYLRSDYCMYEIYKVYQACQGEDESLAKRVIPVVLPEVCIKNFAERAPYIRLWSRKEVELAELLKDPEIRPGARSFEEHRLVRDVANHIDNILVFLQNVLMPRNLKTHFDGDFEAVRGALRSRIQAIHISGET